MTPQERYCTLCAAAVILAFVVLAFYLDPTGLRQLNPFGGEDCAAAHPQAESSQGDYYACELARYTYHLAWSTAALVIATTLLFGIGIYQGVQLRRHAAHTENLAATASETAERQLRAYLQVTPDLNSTVWVNTVHIPVCRIYVKNAGQTPAYEVQSNGAINPAVPSPKTLPEFEPQEEPFRLVIHPGEGHTITLTGDRLLTQDEVDRLIPGTDLRLYLYGRSDIRTPLVETAIQNIE
jgi:hypothetical protein